MTTNPISRFFRRISDSSGSVATPRNWSVLAPPGEIDLATQGYLDLLVDTEWSPDSHLVIDLTGVRFIDSTGLHWLFSAREKAVRADREMRLIVREGSPPDRLLTIAGVREVFPIYRSLEEAVNNDWANGTSNE